MPEIYWLLLLLAGIAGWYLAYIVYRPKSNRNPADIPQGLNYLLNEQRTRRWRFHRAGGCRSRDGRDPSCTGNMFAAGKSIGRFASQNLVVRPTLSSIHRRPPSWSWPRTISRPVSWTVQNPVFDVIRSHAKPGCVPLLLGLYEQKRSGQGD